MPTGFDCEKCGTRVDLARPGKRLRSDSRLCRDCKRWLTRWAPITPEELAARDGFLCRLCDDVVDLTLPYPDWLSPSVDHIIPRSAGGSDEPENLQLAHWICNVRRKDRAMPRR